MNATGTVERMSSREVTTRNGPATSYSLMVAGEWYSAGFAEPKCNEGDNVEFGVTQNGQYKNINKNSIRVVGAGDSTVSVAISPSVPAPTSRDISIGYQSSRKDAIQIVSSLIAADAIALPAKKADKYGAFLALIDEVTAKCFNDLQTVVKAGGLDDLQSAPLPENF